MNKKFRCGDSAFEDTCVFSTITLPSWSALKDEECVTVAEQTEELYKTLSDLKEKFDISDLVSECENYNIKGTDCHTTFKSFAEATVKALDGLMCPSEIKNDVDISNWNLDFKCLKDECEEITKLSHLIQLLINKIDC